MIAVVIPMPKERRGADVRNPPYPPLRAIDHLTNRQPVLPEPYVAPEGGDAA